VDEVAGAVRHFERLLDLRYCGDVILVAQGRVDWGLGTTGTIVMVAGKGGADSQSAAPVERRIACSTRSSTSPLLFKAAVGQSTCFHFEKSLKRLGDLIPAVTPQLRNAPRCSRETVSLRRREFELSLKLERQHEVGFIRPALCAMV
jgi:hypothetical protein